MSGKIKRVVVTTVIGLLFSIVGANSYSNNLPVVDTTPKSVSIGKGALFYKDPSKTLSVNQILSLPPKSWSVNPTETINFGYTGSAYWLLFSLKNNNPEALSRIMEIPYSVLDRIDVYYLKNKTVTRSFNTGDKRPFMQRPLQHRNFLFPMEFGPDEQITILCRVESQSSMQIPIVVESEYEMLEKNQAHLTGLGLYYGIMIAMALYNLFVFISIREKSYFYYVVYVSSMCLFLASLNGISYQFLWSESIWWNDQSIIISLGFLILFAMLFTRNFLDLPGSSPRLNRICTWLVIYCSIVIAISFYLPYRVGIILQIFNAVIMITVALFIGIYRWIQRYTVARYYTTAWVAMLSGGLILAFNKLGIIQRNGFTEHAIQFGSAIEVILLSFAMGDRLNTEKAERIDAQLKALTNARKAREAQEHALAIQKKANESLEQNVYLRTLELEKANVKLKELSITDGLTGLNNRRHFNEIYYSEFARAIRSRSPLSFLIIDVDHFKQFNDSYGHLQGDTCLRTIAAGIESMLLRENDFAARYGGEEFCVLLPDTDAAGAMVVAENIRNHIASIQIDVDGQPVSVTVSIGVACDIPKEKKNTDLLLSRADKALYHSKESGRNQVTLFSTETEPNR